MVVLELRKTVRQLGFSQDGKILCKNNNWLEDMKKKDEKKSEDMHQHKVAQMIKSAEGSAGLLRKITKPTLWRSGAPILGERREDARFLDRCEAKRKEWANHGSVMRKCRT